MKKYFVVSALSGLLCISSAVAAPKTQNKLSATPTKSTVAAETMIANTVEPWKPSAYLPVDGRLAPWFRGLDAKKFHEMFKERVRQIYKGEFETTGDFVRRVEDADSILAPINTTDLYAFSIEKVDAKYDADTQSYLFSSLFAPMCRNLSALEDSRKWKSCRIAAISRTESTYVGSNAFGVSANITQRSGVDFALGIPVESRAFGTFFSNARTSGGNFDFQDSVSVPIAKAKEFSGYSLGVLLIGRVTAAKLLMGKGTHTAPTRTWPYDETIREEAIPFKLERIVYYVIGTGEIIGQRDGL